jgi:hypothetical protein
MTDLPKNQPTFHINTVGNLNMGGVTIQGDQIGIQHHYAPEPKETAASRQLTTLLNKLRTSNPNATDEQIFDILLRGFQTMPQQNPKNWQSWQNILSLLFAGGTEGMKVWQPLAGIPIEIAKRLYEIYQRNQKQLPSR